MPFVAKIAAVNSPKTHLAPDLGDMSKEDFRRLGHELIDWIADYFEHIEELPVLAAIEPGDLKAQLPSTAPAQGEPMEQIIADLDRLIVPALTHWSHPSFFAYFATSTSAPGIFGELLTAAFDNKAMLWRTSPASTELEEVVLDWLRQMMGLDPGHASGSSTTRLRSRACTRSPPRAKVSKSAFAKRE